jgi:hypothetical protein
MSQTIGRSVNAKAINAKLARQWSRLTPNFLPFADAATAELPMARLLRLSLFRSPSAWLWCC